MMLLSGCGSQEVTDSSASKIDFKGYPIETDEKLTLWLANNAQMSLAVSNMGETPFAQELEKRTGVEVEYIHPVIGQESVALGLLLASGEMPDMINYSWKSYNGGGQKNVDEGVIIPLNDLIDKYAPNLKKFLEENPEIDKLVKTDDGTYYVFPFIRNGERLLLATGQMVRRDWVEECGLEMPETVEEIEEVLRAFKAKGVKAPLSLEPHRIWTFMHNFNTCGTFYLDDGKLTYGPMTENYREALEVFKRWYDEGLLDANYVSMDAAALKAKVLSEEVGMTIQAGGGGLGTWLDAWEEQGKDNDMVGFPYTGYKGEEHKVTEFVSKYPGLGSIAITTSCKNPELAVRYLDYGYSEEGSFFYNFGVEGEGYEMVDGEPVFTELITENPDGLSTATAMMMYMRSSSSGPFIQDERYIDMYYEHEQQRESLDAWLKDYDEVVKSNLPDITRTTEEQEEYTSLMTEINEYVTEYRDKFITGKVSLDEWDKYIKQIEKLGIDRVMEIQQTAIDRYNAK